MRQVVLDTETTGLSTADGHRIIEIGCVELINRRLTRHRYHQYIRPDREVDSGAVEVHGITNEFLADKPLFAEIAGDFLAFIDQSELIIHNAPFDVGFIDYELSLLESPLPPVAERCSVLDTLQLARYHHPGQRNTLDALCRRYEIDNSQRDLHGALLDAELLADVYLAMTGGQASLLLDEQERTVNNQQNQSPVLIGSDREALAVVRASDDERAAHDAFLKLIDEQSESGCGWLQQAEF
ncbi:MAG TPA: DNA polymerase III subunit epsilon [Gammaproteobacteria bacterium]|nr:DNA polymerase III subunit epsilon [Gammaproteobacteria bacterium]